MLPSRASQYICIVGCPQVCEQHPSLAFNPFSEPLFLSLSEASAVLGDPSPASAFSEATHQVGLQDACPLSSQGISSSSWAPGAHAPHYFSPVNLEYQDLACR